MPPASPTCLCALVFGCTAAEARERAESLRRHGFAEVHCPSTLAALAALLARQPFDLLLITERDGTTLHEFVRGLRRHPGLPARKAHIVVSLLAIGPTDAERLRDAGVSQIVKEPLDELEISRRLERMSGDRRRFIESPSYCGPDRRGRSNVRYGIPTRRVTDFEIIRRSRG